MVDRTCSAAVRPRPAEGPTRRKRHRRTVNWVSSVRIASASRSSDSISNSRPSRVRRPLPHVEDRPLRGLLAIRLAGGSKDRADPRFGLDRQVLRKESRGSPAIGSPTAESIRTGLGQGHHGSGRRRDQDRQQVLVRGHGDVARRGTGQVGRFGLRNLDGPGRVFQDGGPWRPGRDRLRGRGRPFQRSIGQGGWRRLVLSPPGQGGHDQAEGQRGDPPDEVPLPGRWGRRRHPDQALGIEGAQAQCPRDDEQVADELLGRLIAAVAVLGHQLLDDAGEVGRDPGIQGADVGRRVLLVLEELLEHGPLREGGTSREDIEEGAAERIEVAPDVDVARVACLLGADVVERAERHPALRQPVVAVALEPASQAHVDQLRTALRRDDDIRWLDVAMHHPALVGMHQGVGDLERVVDRFTDRRDASPLDALTDRGPFDVFEGDEMIARVVADRVDAGDILVVELRRGAPFLIEPLDHLGVDGLPGRQELQRDHPFEAGVLGAIDRPHAPHADALDELEAIDPLAGLRQGGWSLHLPRRPPQRRTPREHRRRLAHGRARTGRRPARSAWVRDFGSLGARERFEIRHRMAHSGLRGELPAGLPCCPSRPQVTRPDRCMQSLRPFLNYRIRAARCQSHHQRGEH